MQILQQVPSGQITDKLRRPPHPYAAIYRQGVKAGDGELEVDDDAVIAPTNDGGAYVMSWSWLDNYMVGLEHNESDDEGLETA